MTVDLATNHVAAALQRAGMLPAPPEVLAQLDVACRGTEGQADAVLEISRATWATETRCAEVLVVLMRESIVIVEMRKSGLFKPVVAMATTLPLADYNDLGEIEVEELDGPTVMFLAPDERCHFMLSWPDHGERHRMFLAMFDAHRGSYARWGLQLDPANYAADFTRYYEQIAAEGPSQSSEVYGWVEERFGEFYLSNALGFAMDWRLCELGDAERRGSNCRVGRIAFPLPWVDEGREPQRVVIRLAERLFDLGLLGPPYDERTFNTGEPLSHSDAGPARLIALMTLAGYARALGHPRAVEWIELARVGIPAVPPTVFPESLRTLWSAIDEIPAVGQGPPPEIPIWDDEDVRAISTRDGDRVIYAMDGLTEVDVALVAEFLDVKSALGEEGELAGAAATRACLLGVAAFERLSSEAPQGWRKLVLHAVSDLTCSLWEEHQMAPESAALAHWVIATIETNHWGPDGRTTPLGQHHSYAFGVAVSSGVGVIEIDPVSGIAKAPTGDEARMAAVAGHF
jgi:hypothetical protein